MNATDAARMSGGTAPTCTAAPTDTHPGMHIPSVNTEGCDRPRPRWHFLPATKSLQPAQKSLHETDTHARTPVTSAAEWQSRGTHTTHTHRSSRKEHTRPCTIMHKAQSYRPAICCVARLEISTSLNFAAHSPKCPPRPTHTGSSHPAHQTQAWRARPKHNKHSSSPQPLTPDLLDAAVASGQGPKTNMPSRLLPDLTAAASGGRQHATTAAELLHVCFAGTTHVLAPAAPLGRLSRDLLPQDARHCR
jgi:hypothetical protein